MRTILCVSLLTSLFFACYAGADIVTPRKREEKQKIQGMTIRAYTDAFKKNEPARAFASGVYLSSFGLYIFDRNGNCVAKDDVTQPATADDCIAVWVPPEELSYSIEVRNAGIDENTYRFAVR